MAATVGTVEVDVELTGAAARAVALEHATTIAAGVTASGGAVTGPNVAAMAKHLEQYLTGEPDYIDVLFDGPPAHESGRFVEVNGPDGASLSVGEWIDRGDGLWALRIPRA